jgi:hypothetical protein
LFYVSRKTDASLVTGLRIRYRRNGKSILTSNERISFVQWQLTDENTLLKKLENETLVSRASETNALWNVSDAVF